jgi:hypothetical protein
MDDWDLYSSGPAIEDNISKNINVNQTSFNNNNNSNNNEGDSSDESNSSSDNEEEVNEDEALFIEEFNNIFTNINGKVSNNNNVTLSKFVSNIIIESHGLSSIYKISLCNLFDIYFKYSKLFIKNTLNKMSNGNDSSNNWIPLPISMSHPLLKNMKDESTLEDFITIAIAQSIGMMNNNNNTSSTSTIIHMLKSIDDEILTLSLKYKQVFNSPTENNNSVPLFCSFLYESLLSSVPFVASDIVINVIILTKAGQYTDALNCIHYGITSIFSLIPSNICHYKDSSVQLINKSKLIHLAVQLQTILSIIEESSNLFCKSDRDSSFLQEDSLIWKMGALTIYIKNYIPLLSISIRTAFTFGSIINRNDIILLLLRNPIGFRKVNFNFLSKDLEKIIINKSLMKLEFNILFNNSSSEEVDIIGSNKNNNINNNTKVQDKSSIIPVVVLADSIIVKNDNGYNYFYKLTRSEAIELLINTKPGSFLIRPHDSQVDQYYISFRSDAVRENTSIIKGDEVKHAIIRLDMNTTQTQSQTSYSYRCGKVGPCVTLIDALYAINRVLSHGLIFDSTVCLSISKAALLIISKTSKAKQSIEKPNSDKIEGKKSNNNTVNSDKICSKLDGNHDFWTNAISVLQGVSAINTLYIPSSNLNENIDNNLKVSENESNWKLLLFQYILTTISIKSMLMKINSIEIIDHINKTSLPSNYVIKHNEIIASFISSSELAIHSIIQGSINNNNSISNNHYIDPAILCGKELIGEISKVIPSKMIKISGIGRDSGRSSTSEYIVECIDPNELKNWIINVTTTELKGPNQNSISPGISPTAISTLSAVKSFVQEFHSTDTVDEQSIMSWLCTKNILSSVVKHHESAFLSAQTTLRVIDPWEVTVVIDVAATFDKIKYGRNLYSSIEIRNNYMYNNDDENIEKSNHFNSLWKEVNALDNIISLVGNMYEQKERDGSNIIIHKEGIIDPYSICLSRYLYRNSIFSQLGLPHRYIATTQIDVYGLKEVGTSKDFNHNNAATMDVYAAIRLGKEPLHKRTSNEKNANVGTGRCQLDGTAVTSIRKALLVRGDVSRASRGVEYTWREQANLRYPLPDVSSDDILNPPMRIHVAIYERSFFSDTKLGELDLPMAALTDEKLFKEWIPLTSDKGGSFFIHLQAQLKFHIMEMVTDNKTFIKTNIISSIKSNKTITETTTSTIPTVNITNNNNNKSSINSNIRNSNNKNMFGTLDEVF